MYEFLGVFLVDDAIVLGIAAAALLFAKRQYRVEREFLEEHGDRIERENQRIVRAWRASRPRQKKLVIDRTFTPPVLLPPKVGVRRKYKRDPRPW